MTTATVITEVVEAPPVDWSQFSSALELRDFQVEGITKMRSAKRMLNRYKPGLGKTICGTYASVGPTLIVCPNYLTEQWYTWLAGDEGFNAHPPYAPADRQNIVWVKGTRYEKLMALCRGGVDFHVVNMETLQTHADEIIELSNRKHWQTLIIDESHHFRNKDARRSRTAVELARDCEYVFELTGTPIWREVDDLYMQLKLLHPDVFTSYYSFVDLYCIADTDRYGTKVRGVKKSMIKELDEIMDVVSINATYESAGRQLPPIIEKFIPVEFPPKLRDAYNSMVNGYRIDFEGDVIRFENFLQILRAMRLMTAFQGKLEAAVEAIEDLHTNDKVVVFTWYRETCENIARMLHTDAIHGEMPVAQRRELALKNKIVCANLASLGEGIDLSEARAIIFLEEHYTHGAMEQAIARVVRERQNANNTDPVLVYYIYVPDSIDVDIHNISKQRGASARQVLKEALHVVEVLK